MGMGIADMDFKAAPCIGRALAERCKHENWGYLSTPKSYINAIVSWNKRRLGLEIDPETIALSDGVHPGLIAALKTFSPPGSKVLLMTPTYNGFYGDLRASFTLPADSPMKVVNGRYSIDFDDLQSRISADTNTLILCNPQNPTGNCWSKEDLMRLGKLCLERRVVVLADEIHCDLVMKGQKFTPFASLPDKDIVNNSLTFKAMSKTFSLAAMKSAYFFSTNRDYLEKVKANNRANTNTLGVVANEAAYNEGEAWLDQLLPYIDGNHDYVESYMRDKMPLVKYTKAQATYLAWLDVSEVVREDRREGAGRKRDEDAGRFDAARHARDDRRALVRREREGPPESRIVVRHRRSGPHADEPRDVPQAHREGLRQHGGGFGETVARVASHSGRFPQLGYDGRMDPPRGTVPRTRHGRKCSLPRAHDAGIGRFYAGESEGSGSNLTRKNGAG